MKRKRLSDHERGNVTIEFALSCALLFPILAGSFQFGYSFFQYNKLQTAVRGGARYASQLAYDSATDAPSAAFLEAVRNSVLYGDPHPAAPPPERQPGVDLGATLTPVVAGLQPENVTVKVTFGSGVPQLITVGISGYQLDGVFGSVTLNNRPAVAFPHTGRFSPP